MTASLCPAAKLKTDQRLFYHVRRVILEFGGRLAQADRSSVDRWVTTLEKRLGLHDSFRYEDELTHITQARVFIAQNKLDEATRLLSCLEESAQPDGRQGRLIEILMLKALALQKLGNNAQADLALTKSLTLARPSGYLRIFLDKGQPIQMLLAQWMAHARSSPLRDYAIHLLPNLMLNHM